MGRPPKPLPLTVDELRQRYERGQSLELLAAACGVASSKPIRRAFREAGIPVRPPGMPAGRAPSKPSRRIALTCKRDGCSNTFEIYPSQNKRYCQPSCRYSCTEMASLLARNISGRHILSDVDAEALTATCTVCGPVRVRRRIDGPRAHSTNVTWRCRTAEKARTWAREYGLSIEDIFGALEKQHHACAICKVAFADDFYVDHCHKTGIVRGLLCSQCNTGLGLFKDSPDILRIAAIYLESAVLRTPA